MAMLIYGVEVVMFIVTIKPFEDLELTSEEVLNLSRRV